MLIGDDSANEDPRLSSAASLLRLGHLGATFGPTYTHQCFDDERVRGFQPYDDAIRETERRYATSPLALMNDVNAGAGAGRLAVSRQASKGLRESLVRSHDLPHKSFQHHETATHRLSLEVVLAPSCQSCAVIIRTEAKKRDRAGSTASEASLVSASSASSSSVPSSRSVSPYFDLQVQPTNDNTAAAAAAAAAASGGGGGGAGGRGGKRRRVGRNDSDCENNDRKSPPLAVGAAPMSVLEQLDSIADGNGIGTNANNATTAGPKIVFSSKSTTGIPLAPGANTMVVHPLSTYAAANSTGGGGRAGRTRRRRMEIDEVLERISRTLPPVVRCDHIRTDELGGGDDDSGGGSAGLQLPLVQVGGATIDEVRGAYLSHPLGTVLKKYQRPIRNANATLTSSAKINDNESMGDFVLCLADGRDEGVAAYHNRVQRLALWYIENDSEVDLASTDSGGYWKVLYVFRRHKVAGAGDDNHGDDAKMPLVAAEETEDGKDSDDVKPAASSSSDQTSHRPSHQSSPLVKRAVKSFYSTCDSLVSLFSGRHNQGSDNSRSAFEERVNAEPLDLPLPSSQSLDRTIDDGYGDDEDSSSNTVKYEYSLVGL